MSNLTLKISRDEIQIDSSPAHSLELDSPVLKKIEANIALQTPDVLSLGHYLFHQIFSTVGLKSDFLGKIQALNSEEPLTIFIICPHKELRNIPYEFLNPEGTPDGFLITKGKITVIRVDSLTNKPRL